MNKRSAYVPEGWRIGDYRRASIRRLSTFHRRTHMSMSGSSPGEHGRAQGPGVTSRLLAVPVPAALLTCCGDHSS